MVEFIADIQAAAVKEKQATKADNVNEYRSAKSGYGSSTYMKPSATATAAPAAAATIAPPKAVTEDFVSK